VAGIQRPVRLPKPIRRLETCCSPGGHRCARWKIPRCGRGQEAIRERGWNCAVPVDGEYRWFSSALRRLRINAGNVNWHGVLTDIEDRKPPEQALKRSEAYLAEAQELTKNRQLGVGSTFDRMVYCSVKSTDLRLDPAEGIPSIEHLYNGYTPMHRAMVRAQSLQASCEGTEHAFDTESCRPDGCRQACPDSTTDGYA